MHRPGIRSWLYHLLAEIFGTCDFPAGSFAVLICKLGIMTPTHPSALLLGLNVITQGNCLAQAWPHCGFLALGLAFPSVLGGLTKPPSVATQLLLSHSPSLGLELPSGKWVLNKPPSLFPPS